jgi:hypothetical protein
LERSNQANHNIQHKIPCIFEGASKDNGFKRSTWFGEEQSQSQYAYGRKLQKLKGESHHHIGEKQSS